MFLFLFALWILLNGRITLETVLLGLLFSGAVLLFACRYMGHSISTEKKLYALLPRIPVYGLVLAAEICRSALAACSYVLSARKRRPLIYKFRTPLRTEAARVALANSITLTPGTITVSLEDGVYTVHCLDESMSKKLADGTLVKLLMKMEEAF